MTLRLLFDHLVGARETDGGTVMPSALAVLRLMTSSYLVGACTGRSGRLLALEDAIDIAGRLPELAHHIRSV